jgi:predicted RNase H-like nuclease
MEGLGKFLEKFKHIIPENHTVKDAIRECVSVVCFISLENKYITYKNYTIILSTCPTIKNEILLHKQSILEKIKTDYPDIYVLDIR